MTEDDTGLTVAQMSAETGVSGHTLRYYERAGLIRPVARNSGNQRRYSRADVEWVKFLLRLRETNMPIAQMREYALLRERGEATTRLRLEMLEVHRARLREQIAQLTAHEHALAAKITTYQDQLAILETPQEDSEHA